MVGTPAASAVFDFENILPQLDFLPIAARRALDHAGLRLSLEAWRSLGLDDRCQLVAAGANDIVDSTAVAGVVRRASPPAQRIEVVGDPDPLAPPDGLLRLLEPVPLDARQWARLRALDRYALAHVHRRSIARNDPTLIQAAYEDIVMGHLRSLRPPPGEAGGRGNGSTTPPPEVPPPPPLPRTGRDGPSSPRGYEASIHRDEPASSSRGRDVAGRAQGTAYRRPVAPDLASAGYEPSARSYEMPSAGRVQDVFGRHEAPSPSGRAYSSQGRAYDAPAASPRHETPPPPRVSSVPPPVEMLTAEELIGEQDTEPLPQDHDPIPDLTPPGGERLTPLIVGERLTPMMGDHLSSHLTEQGDARMVDVGEKPITVRRAVAAATVTMRRETFRRLAQAYTPKGDVLAAARIAGIMAAKRTSELIPLCHGIAVTKVEVAIDLDGASCAAQITATAEAVDRTGVEMEAMVAASIAGLTIYDMLKGIDRDMTLTDVKLLEKSGGRTGHYQRREA